MGKWDLCCAEEIKRLWIKDDPMVIVWYTGTCPKCGHFIGLTQTSEKEAVEFLEEYGLEYNK